MQQKLEQTGEFFARAANGQRYRIVEHTHFIDYRALADHAHAEKWIPRVKQYRLTSGYSVHRISAVVFEIVITRERVTIER